MPLPVNAQVGAVPNFTFNLDAANAFSVAQDADCAASRFAKLKGELREMRAMLSWSPACGRPARFLSAHSAQARFRAEAILELAKQVGLPSLRQYVVAKHIVLYAHSDSEVVLLALKSTSGSSHTAWSERTDHKKTRRLDFRKSILGNGHFAEDGEGP